MSRGSIDLIVINALTLNSAQEKAIERVHEKRDELVEQFDLDVSTDVYVEDITLNRVGLFTYHLNIKTKY